MASQSSYNNGSGVESVLRDVDQSSAPRAAPRLINKTNSRMRRTMRTNTFYKGECYLALLSPGCREDAREVLGVWPSVGNIVQYVGQDYSLYSDDKLSFIAVPYPKPDSLCCAVHIIPGQQSASDLLCLLADGCRVGGDEEVPLPPEEGEVPPPGDDPQPDHGETPVGVPPPTLPPGTPDDEAPLPPPDKPLTPPVRSGDKFGTVGPQEEATDPVEAVETNGWLDYDVPSLTSNNEYGGLVTHAKESHEWVSSLHGIANHFPMFNNIRKKVHQLGQSPTISMDARMLWGMGVRTSGSYATQASFADTRSVPLWTTNHKFEAIAIDDETVLFDVQAGISIDQRVSRTLNVFVGDGARDLKYRLNGDMASAEQYMASVSSLAAAGRNNIAFLTIAYTRIVATILAEEQGLEPHVAYNVRSYNSNVLRSPGAQNPLHEAVLAYLATRPDNMVLLPRSSTRLDERYMMYLMGNGRLVEEISSTGQKVMSVYDRFIPSRSFKLSPMRGDATVSDLTGEVEYQQIRGSALVDLLDRYVNENQLWDQMAIARNQALSMMFSTVFSATFSLPHPAHTNDAQLHLVHTGHDVKRGRNVVDAEDDMRSIVIAGTVLCHAMVEVLFEGVVSTMETSAGIGPRGANFYAAVDTRQDDFNLGIKLALVTLPVVERFTSCKTAIPIEFCSPSNTNFVRSIALGWEARPFRVSSYLMLDCLPSDQYLATVFSENARRRLGANLYNNVREDSVATWLFTDPGTVKDVHFTYGAYFDTDISKEKEYHGFSGNAGRFECEYMVGEPQLWETYMSSVSTTFKDHEPTEGEVVSELESMINDLFDEMVGPEVGTSKGKQREATAGGSNVQRTVLQYEELSYQRACNEVDRQDATDNPDVRRKEGLLPVEASRPTRRKRRVDKGGWFGTKPRNPGSESSEASASVEKTRGGKVAKGKRSEASAQPATPIVAWPKDEAGAKKVDSLFPRGKDEQLKRAIYTVGRLLLELNSAGISAQERDDVLLFLNNGVGGKNAWAAGVVMYLVSHQLTKPCYAYLVSMGLLSTRYEQWADRWANLNDVLRNMVDSESWPYTNQDFTSSLYLAGLVGRPHREVEWDAEVEKRQLPDVPLKSYTSEGFKDMGSEEEKQMIMDFLRAEAKIKIKRCQPFEEYYRSRAQWMIRGSMGGEQTVLDTEPDVRRKLAEEGFKVQHNTTKVHVSEMVDYEWMKSVLELDPVHLAKMHTKGQENAKIRSIQASLYSHYVLGSYWSKHLESTLSLSHATMNKPNHKLLEESEMRRRASESTETTKVCLDYPDFGATHSCRQQYLVLECIYEFALEKGFQPTEDFVEIQDWYKRSFLNQWAMRPDDKSWFKCTTGMFSGVVQTTLFNTVMNGALRRHAVKTLSLMGNPVAMLANSELGDDGWALFPDRKQAEAYVAVIPLVGKELNALKQLVSSQGSEYLREWYMDGVVYGCPVRALAMLISGNVENNVASAGATRIRELYESFSTLARRGFKPSICQFFFEKLSVYEARKGTLGSKRVLTYLYTSRAAGGLALYPISQMPTWLTYRAPGAVEERDEAEGDEDIVARVLLEAKAQKKFKASVDYVETVERKYCLDWVHGGKAQATAATAASGISGGNQTTSLQHEKLEIAVTQATWSGGEWKAHQDELERAAPRRVGAQEISKQFNKISSEDRVLMSEIGKIARLVRFMTKESEEMLAQRISDREGVPAEKVSSALRSLKYVKQDSLDYAPSPLLSQELMGVYTQWKAVDKNAEVMTLPSWLPSLAAAYKS